MNQRKFLGHLSILAKMCHFELTPEMVGLYDRSLRELGYDAACRAIETAIIKRKGTDRFPSIHDLVSLIRPQCDDKDLAVEVAGRIAQAISDYGSWRHDDARKFLGTIAWKVVERCGGWETLCGSILTKDIQVHKAQWREMAQSLIHRSRAGELERAPDFGALSDNVEKLIGSIGSGVEHGT